MAQQPRSAPIRRFQAVSSLEETTDMGVKLEQARNILLRPLGGFKGIPKYLRLWGIGNAASIYSIVTGLPHPTASRNLDDTDNTVALQVSNQGKNFLVFYSVPDRKARSQVFYLGDDGTYTSGAYDFTAGTAVWNVLATGLDRSARWYGQRFYTAIFLGNGVDDNLIAQLGRTGPPGILRKAGSNARPNKPVISATAPATSSNTQASVTFASRAGGQSLVFTANATNFPGEVGNDKISVRITNSGVSSGIVSTLTGEGTVSNPYLYVITTGTAAVQSSNKAVVEFVNADSKVLSILSAGPTASPSEMEDTGEFGPTLLAGGTGSGSSDGFSNRTVSIFARYWDPGTDGLGYEGPSSEKSNELILPGDAANDILVNITPDASAEGGRFPFIRLYMQFGEDADAIWSLVEPDNPFPNSALTAGTSFAAAPATDYLYAYSTSEAPVVLPSVDVVELAVAPADQTPVFFLATTMPGGLVAGRVYYVKRYEGSSMGFFLAKTPGGSKINITSAGSGVMLYFPVNHGMQTGRTTVVLATTGTLPAPLDPTPGSYHVIAAENHQFKLSNSKNGTAINITDTGTGTHTFVPALTEFQIGTATVFGQALVDDQNRPLPHVHHCMANEQVWRAGVTGFPERIYASKQAVEDELAPEGVFLEGFITAQSQNNQAGSGEITALTSDNFRLSVHTRAGVTLIDPANVENRFDPNVFAGALNGSLVTTWKGGMTYYLGADLQLYTIRSSRYGRQDSDFAAVGAAAYIRDRVDVAAISRTPERCWLFPDIVSQHIWFSLPANDGTLKMFAYDLLNQGIVGEFDFPKVYGSTQMEPERPEIVFCDEDMNLFVWDTANQNDRGDTFGTVAAFTPQAEATAIPAADAGYGNVVRAGRRYLRAYESTLETAFFDLGSPDRRKAFTALLFRSLAGSRALVSVTLTDLAGESFAFNYGDIGEYGAQHRLNCFLGNTTAVKMTFTILGAEQKPWVIRDVTALWLPQGLA